MGFLLTMKDFGSSARSVQGTSRALDRRVRNGLSISDSSPEATLALRRIFRAATIQIRKLLAGTFNPLFPRTGDYFWHVLATTGPGPINFMDVHPRVEATFPNDVTASL